MAGARQSARTRGKSDAIDALAIARAALREEGKLHPASHDPKARELKLLVDHREGLVRERTILASRLRLSPRLAAWTRPPHAAASPSALPGASSRPRCESAATSSAGSAI